MECDASFWSTPKTLSALCVARFVSLVTALWILLLGARRRDSIGRLSLAGSGSYGLARESGQFASSLRFLIAISVRSFFLLIHVVPVDQRLQTLSFAGSPAASCFQKEARQISAHLRVETS